MSETIIVGLKAYHHRGRIRVEEPTPDFYRQTKREKRILAESRTMQPFARIPHWIEVKELN